MRMSVEVRDVPGVQTPVQPYRGLQDPRARAHRLGDGLIDRLLALEVDRQRDATEVGLRLRSEGGILREIFPTEQP